MGPISIPSPYFFFFFPSLFSMIFLTYTITCLLFIQAFVVSTLPIPLTWPDNWTINGFNNITTSKFPDYPAYLLLRQDYGLKSLKKVMVTTKNTTYLFETSIFSNFPCLDNSRDCMFISYNTSNIHEPLCIHLPVSFNSWLPSNNWLMNATYLGVAVSENNSRKCNVWRDFQWSQWWGYTVSNADLSAEYAFCDYYEEIDPQIPNSLMCFNASKEDYDDDDNGGLKWRRNEDDDYDDDSFIINYNYENMQVNLQIGSFLEEYHYPNIFNVERYGCQ